MKKKIKIKFADPRVADVYASIPENILEKLLQIRELIFQIAASDPRIGPVTETLKWNEPAYLTIETGSGSTIRLNRRKNSNTEYGIYFNCQTILVAEFRKKFGKLFRFEKNRAILFSSETELPVREIKECIRLALLYQLTKRGML
jgi:hypothetical protein